MYVAKVVLKMSEKALFIAVFFNYYPLIDANILKIITSIGLYYGME